MTQKFLGYPLLAALFVILAGCFESADKEDGETVDEESDDSSSYQDTSQHTEVKSSATVDDTNRDFLPSGNEPGIISVENVGESEVGGTFTLVDYPSDLNSSLEGPFKNALKFFPVASNDTEAPKVNMTFYLDDSWPLTGEYRAAKESLMRFGFEMSGSEYWYHSVNGVAEITSVSAVSAFESSKEPHIPRLLIEGHFSVDVYDLNSNTEDVISLSGSILGSVVINCGEYVSDGYDYFISGFRDVTKVLNMDNVLYDTAFETEFCGEFLNIL